MGDIIQDTSDPVGDYPLGLSSYLAAILLVGHMSAAALLWWLDFSLLWKTVAWGLLLASLIHEERMAWRLGANAVLALRIERDGVTELVIATNPTMSGEATALFLADRVRDRMTVTRLASGLPVGADLEHADELTLGRAFLGRREI